MKLRYLPVVALAAFAACDSPLNTEPTASIDASTALSSARGVSLALNGAYRTALSSSLWGKNVMVYPDLYSDNLDFTGTFQTDREISLRNVTVGNGDTYAIWQLAYQAIGRANSILDALPTVGDMSDAQKNQAKGEALFIRGLYYSELARWFGGVPIVLKHAEGVGPDALVSRATLQETWAQVEKDLEEAATLLPSAKNAGRATKGAANALLARVYLEDAKYALARDKATAVIGDAAAGYKLNTNYADNWRTKNSTESILEFQSTTASTNSLSFWYFPSTLGGRYGFAPSNSLNSAYEAGDNRKSTVIGTLSNGSRYGNKFARVTTQDDNLTVLRLAEMYLARAEANARLGASAATVLADVNVIRQRAGLAPLDPAVVSTQTQLLDAILQERRVELALEGQRFFDLRRFGKAQTVLSISADKLILPIPQGERDVNPNLTQNPGY